MLRLTARKSWNRSQPSPAAFIARNLADSSDSSGSFVVSKPFGFSILPSSYLHLIRGFSSESLNAAQETGLAQQIPPAMKNPSSKIRYTMLRFAARRLPAAFMARNPFPVAKSSNYSGSFVVSKLSGFSILPSGHGHVHQIRGFSSLTAAQETGLAQQTPPTVVPPSDGDDGGGADALVIILPTSDVPPPGEEVMHRPMTHRPAVMIEEEVVIMEEEEEEEVNHHFGCAGSIGSKKKGAFIVFVVLTARMFYMEYNNMVPGSVASINVVLKEKQKLLAIMDKKLDSGIQMVELDEKLDSGSKRMELMDEKRM